MNILSVTWFSQGYGPCTIGIVVVENEYGEKKAYMGTADGLSEKADVQHIIDWGAKVAPGVLENIEGYMK